MSAISHDAVVARTQAPLYVDVDGSLLRSNLLLESLLSALRKAPYLVFMIPWWLLRGRAYLKAQLAARSEVDASTLPYHTDLLEYLRHQQRAGRRLILATAANERLANDVARHLGIFRSVLASSTDVNLKGARKAEAIASDAAGPFAYAGNDGSDLKIWRISQAAVLVNTSANVSAKARHLCPIEQEFPRTARRAGTYLRAIRVYQWLKNVLVFLPLFTAHLWLERQAWQPAVLAFVAFCLCASAIYLLNDLSDLAADRRHPRKRLRPLASGAVPIEHALVLAPILLLAGVAVAAIVGSSFLLITLAYVATTTAYSLRLKNFVLADVITLAGLYTIRVIAGAIAVNVTPSFWLLAFSMSIFVSLALIKRCAELLVLTELNRRNSAGRDYRVTDLPVLQSMGVASGFSAVLVLALFINSDNVAAEYAQPEMLWPLCGACLYWVARMWIKTSRGEMTDDPLLYAARDLNSLVVLAVSIFIVLIAN
jgi:4-hydroxybenzoate polyprenyltransferase